MERIRIVKRKRRSHFLPGMFIALIILSAIIWLAIDNKYISFDGVSANKDSANQYNNYTEQQTKVDRYISFVNMQVVPADSIDQGITQNGLIHLTYALNEIVEKVSEDEQNLTFQNHSTDSISSASENPEDSDIKALTETGIVLIDIQKNNFPDLSNESEKVKISIDRVNNKNKEDLSKSLKNFFIASSQLLEEMNDHKMNDQLTFNQYKTNK